MTRDATTSTPHLLCLGFGYAARAIAGELAEEGWQVTGTTRSAGKAAELRRDGIGALVWEAPAPLPAEALAGISDILVSVSPTDTGCPALAGLRPLGKQLEAVRSITYLSSTGVYGDHDGRWVNEDGPLMPDTHRGRARLQAEHRWEDFAAEHDIDMVALRLAGIYGPGRNALETLRRQQGEAPSGLGQRIFKKGQVFSRIHVADIAAAAAQLFATAGTEDWPDTHAINLADDLPSPPHEVIEYAAYLLSLDPPPLVPLEEAELSPMARSFYVDNKRVSNRLMKDVLGHEPLYPSYREGLTALLKTLPEPQPAPAGTAGAADSGETAEIIPFRPRG